MNINQPLLENSFYHIYNRGNNGDNIFYQQRNYDYFLKKYDQYLSDYVETYAYCLLPNHFHLLIRVKPYSDFPAKSPSDAIPLIDDTLMTESNAQDQRNGMAISPEQRVNEQFRRFFISYSQAISKQESRTGSLFQKPFKRKEVDKESYFTHLIYYIHANPQKHGICDDFRHYEHSSYGRILSERPAKLLRQEVIDWYGGKTHYTDFHERSLIVSEKENWFIEED